MYYTTPQSVISGSPRLFTRGGGPYTEGVDNLLKITDVGGGVPCPSGSYVLITQDQWNLVSSPNRYTATADDYIAVSAIFGVILTAACLIWGSKQLLNLLHNRPES